MQRKKIGCYITLVPVIIVVIVILIIHLKNTLSKQTYEKSFLAPFHEIYDVLCEKYPFITSLHEEAGASGCYGAYFIECDFAENIDCFAKLVDVQRNINDLMESRKDDEWFNEFEGHIQIYAGRQQLRVFYHNGSMRNGIWANDVISDDYSVLWDIFRENDEIYLVLFLSDYSDEKELEITQKYEGRNIIVRPQFGE